MIESHILLRYKFATAFICAICWMLLSAYLGQPWFHSLTLNFGEIPAILIVLFIALIPGFMNMFILVSFLFNKRTEKQHFTKYPNVSVLITAYNESDSICDTVSSVLAQRYPGKIQIIVIDDGSTDDTLATLNKNIGKLQNLTIIANPHRGKSFALNAGLAKAKHELLVTIDGDSHLLPNAIERIVAKYLSSASDTVAVSGGVYPINPDQNFMTRIQKWEYFLGIATVKSVQCFLQGTLVAQGAFSLFRKSFIELVGGWKDTVGEDIVLTWTMLKKGCRILHADDAILLTKMPQTYKSFFFQRSRWSRGMIEAFRHNPQILKSWRLSTFLVYWDLLFPFVDLAYCFIFIPGVIAAFFGYYAIAGLMTLAVLPIGILFTYVYVIKQKNLLKGCHLKVKMDFWSCIVYVLFYNMLMVPACIHGYFSEFFNLKKKWGTK